MRARLLQPRFVALVVWLVAFAIYAGTFGLPTKRGNVLIWAALAIVAIGVDQPRSTLRSFLTTWLPLFAALGAYDLLRGSSDGAAAIAHTWPHMNIDLWIGAGTLPSVRLQEWLWNAPDPSWWDYAAWVTYQSHFFVPLLVAIVLWARRDDRATPYIIGLAALSWMALATYWLYPAQPPWMVARDGLVDSDVSRVVQQMWRDVGVDRAARVFTTSSVDGNRYSNPVAALPSLHGAIPMLIAVVLWGTRRWLNVVLVLYVLAMGTTLVYAGEHFIFDILLGWIYALVVGLVAVRWRSASSSRSGESLPSTQLASSGTGGS
jgi:hypothetical protein